MSISLVAKRICIIALIIFTVILVLIFSLNFYVKLSTKKQIITDLNSLKDLDCLIVLGAGVWGEKPSPMLEDRLNKAIELYHSHGPLKIIMSGDHTTTNYDEVNIMKKYAINKGVASSDIFMDHAGISTYDSIYRLKYIFNAQKVVIVTQDYHLYRSLYVARKLGIEAYGVSAVNKKYAGAFMREAREILARTKDVFKCIIKPKSKYMGETILVSGNGDITNDLN